MIYVKEYINPHTLTFSVVDESGDDEISEHVTDPLSSVDRSLVIGFN